MDKNLLHKINDLFEYRGFPELYKYSNLPPSEVDDLNDLLVQLQASIYYLDEYLETNWEIKQKDLNKYWDNIYIALGRLDIGKKDQKTYCSQIMKYQKHEIDLRSHLLPTRLNTEFFYFYKSCDVKLMRRLLLEKLPIIHTLFNSADWRYFDLVTEINDDTTDLEEDLYTINANMVLICYNLYGRSATIDIFGKFLDYCVEQSHIRFANTINPYKKNIHKQTVQQAIKTKKLLTQSKVLKQDTESVLYKHLKSMRA